MKVCTNLEVLTDQCSLRFLWINWYWMTANWFCIMSVTYCLMLRCSVFHYMCFMFHYIQTLLHRQYQQMIWIFFLRDKFELLSSSAVNHVITDKSCSQLIFSILYFFLYRFAKTFPRLPLHLSVWSKFFFIHMFKEEVYFIKYYDHWCGKQISV